ncbi:hypothetical protein SAMN05661044_02703 [Olivibacter domesticus]|uniref:Uncharacterized protein n=1 Tax=Olivibacter domesticus TaxID=407022 RepID=A0A1H7QTW5_OLID1|nr:hypothetical protein SAMN05661044_02703 [Olivibacter domesticus]
MQYNRVAYNSSLLVSPLPFGAYCYRGNIKRSFYYNKYIFGGLFNKILFSIFMA